MLNILNIILMLLSLGIPFFGLISKTHRFCPVVVSLLTCSLFVVSQIVVLALCTGTGNRNGFDDIAADCLRVSLILVCVTVLLNGFVLRLRHRDALPAACAAIIAMGLLVMLLPYTYYVNSKQNCYAYNEGQSENLGTYMVTFRGVYIHRILNDSYFSGEWKITGFTDGFEPITMVSPDDRPYKNVTRYDENGEILRQASFQVFGNSRFNDYVILVGQVVGWDTDWDPAHGTILCPGAETYNEMVEAAARNNIGYLDPIEGEVTP